MPRLLDTNTPQLSATGSALSLGTHPAGAPPPPPPPVLVLDPVLTSLKHAIVPSGQHSALRWQSFV
jgi:hypothetical protein